MPGCDAGGRPRTGRQAVPTSESPTARTELRDRGDHGGGCRDELQLVGGRTVADQPPRGSDPIDGCVPIHREQSDAIRSTLVQPAAATGRSPRRHRCLTPHVAALQPAVATRPAGSNWGKSGSPLQFPIRSGSSGESSSISALSVSSSLCESCANPSRARSNFFAASWSPAAVVVRYREVVVRLSACSAPNATPRESRRR